MADNKLLKRWWLLPVALLCGFHPSGLAPASAEVQAVQRQGMISGTVVDQNGETVIGASVIIEGGKTTQGTVTDFDGKFSLKVAPGTKLRITFVGYKPAVVSAKNGMKVVLEENSNVLQGVEVVAYGTQKKVTVTGALSSIKGEEIVRTPVSSVNNVLAGQLSGVTTVQYSGEPGSDAATVFVRGQATWEDSAPLIQVDGVERSMSDIDPNEIESITVLKDASATAVFGVRGANGVVLITTKRGKEGKARISGSTSFSLLMPTKMVEQASSYEYALFHNMMRENDGGTPQFSDEQLLEKFRTGSDPIRFPSTEWADYIMKDATLQTQHNVNISGGSEKVRYFISAGVFTQGGLFQQFNQEYDNSYAYNRFNYRANLDMDVTNTTTLSFNIAGNMSNAHKPYTGQGASGMIMLAYQATPFSSPGIVDDRLVATTTDYADVQLPFVGSSGMGYYGTGFMNTQVNKLQMDLQLEQKLDMITKGLSFKIKGSYNSQYNVLKNGSAAVATYNPVLQDDGTIAYRKIGSDEPVSYSTDTGKARDWYAEASFNYNRSFGLHTIGALLLYNQSKQYYYSSTEYPDLARGYVGLVGRVTYDWNNRYLAEFNIGYNGSENFAPENRFGTFPAGSIGWVVSEEKFFKPLSKVVSFFKLRASWGLVGNDKIGGSRFMYLDDPYTVNNGAIWARGGRGYSFGIENSTIYPGAFESSRNNPEVTWEKAFKQDYGFDLNLFDNRLRTVFDYYKEHRTNILLRDGTAPSIIGFDVPYTNQGEVDSWGWELSLKWQDEIGKDFRYWVGVNLSYNQNEIKEMKEAPLNNEYQYQKGHRIGSRSQYLFWKYYYDGAEADYEREFGQPFPQQIIANENLNPGDAIYVDLDGNGVINENDMSRDYGYTDDPEYIAGLNLGFKWKDLSVNMQFTGAWNVSRYLSDVFMRPFQGRTTTDQGGLLKYHLDHTWTVDNPSQDAEYPRVTQTNGSQNYATSTLYEKDAKYLRLKTLEVAYDFHFPFMRSIGLNQFQLALSGYNLFTISPYIWGDPETRASASPSYPLQRTYTVSLKLGF